MIGMEIYVVDDRIACRWGLQCCQMAVTSYQGVVRLFPQRWQCHHLIIASTTVSTIPAGMTGNGPKLNASLLQCTLSRPGTPFNKFLNESYSYCGCNEPSCNQQPFGFAAIQHRNNDPHHAYPNGDEQRTIDAKDDLSHQSPPVLTSSIAPRKCGGSCSDLRRPRDGWRLRPEARFTLR
jgi:hypothetical protein